MHITSFPFYTLVTAILLGSLSSERMTDPMWGFKSRSFHSHITQHRMQAYIISNRFWYSSDITLNVDWTRVYHGHVFPCSCPNNSHSWISNLFLVSWHTFKTWQIVVGTLQQQTCGRERRKHASSFGILNWGCISVHFVPNSFSFVCAGKMQFFILICEYSIIFPNAFCFVFWSLPWQERKKKKKHKNKSPSESENSSSCDSDTDVHPAKKKAGETEKVSMSHKRRKKKHRKKKHKEWGAGAMQQALLCCSMSHPHRSLWVVGKSTWTCVAWFQAKWVCFFENQHQYPMKFYKCSVFPKKRSQQHLCIPCPVLYIHLHFFSRL